MKYDKEEKVFFLIQKGCEYENVYHDLRKACEYYKEARTCLNELYGKESKLSNIVNIYDYVWEKYQGDYRTAIIKLSDAGELLEHFSEHDIVDEFTARIGENKRELLDEVITKTLNLLKYFDLNHPLEDIAMQMLLFPHNLEEVVNRTLIDPLGLPRKFHYLIDSFRCEKDVNANTKELFAQIYYFMQDKQDMDYSTIDNEKRISLAKSFYDLIQKIYDPSNKNLSKGMSLLLDSVSGGIDFQMMRGMLGMGEIEFAESLFSKLTKDYDYDDFESKVKIKFVECIMESKKGNKENAEKILNEIIELENNIIMQIFFMNKEQKKIEFLRGIEYLMKRTAEITNQIQGAEAAYSLVARTRTLSFDHASIHLSGEEHKHIIFKKQQIDMREKAGEDVTLENKEIEDYFEKISKGIFEFDSQKVCKKLTDKQALLEFTIMKNEMDYDFYYVFVVTNKGILLINLGECSEINEQIEEILKYISIYSASRYSSCPIRMLQKYHDLYEMVLLPIGKILPQNIHSLFIAGAGKFLEIPFGMLPCFHWYDRFIEDEYHIYYVNSGKELLCDTNCTPNQSAVVIGNPDFCGKFPALPASEKEVEMVANLLKVKPITGVKAVPECLKQSANIFHISTHSYVRDKSEVVENMDPMEQVGLVFAGAQLLSANKISQIDMNKTNLVVLSVCGERENEGVYSDIGMGIRRAFINAGAKHIILNLWKTDDIAAQLLMKSFYDYYIQGKKSIEESLRAAKYYLRTSSVYTIRKGKYYDENMEKIFGLMREDEIPYNHPYYWAGFIMLGV